MRKRAELPLQNFKKKIRARSVVFRPRGKIRHSWIARWDTTFFVRAVRSVVLQPPGEIRRSSAGRRDTTFCRSAVDMVPIKKISSTRTSIFWALEMLRVDTSTHMKERSKQGVRLQYEADLSDRWRPWLVGSVSDSRVGGSGSSPGSVTFYY